MQGDFDKRWREMALAGEPQAVARLAEAAIGPLYRFCMARVGGNHHLCEEVVQETLLQAIGRLKTYDPGRSGGVIFGWLTGLARNEIRRVLSREKAPAALADFWRRVDDELRSLYAMIETEPLAQDLLEREETREIVNATMAQLPPHYGQALQEKYVTKRSVSEIAAAMGMSVKAAESLLARAREAFRVTFLALVGKMEGAR
ncbi:MAG: sigma-70 family RNA polymerase sigma factor [Planctomycetota bacterium]|nr:sigma-70 family RNA polymerase sigma factor [Planctomycetota bacterium]